MQPFLYIYTLHRSLTSGASYLGVVKNKLWFSIRYFLISLSILGIISGVFFVDRVWLPLKTTAQVELLNLAHYYPSDIIVSWNNQTLLINSEAPIQVPYPKSMPLQDLIPHHLLTITDPGRSAADFVAESGNSSFLVADSQHLFINNLNGRWRQLPLTEILSEPFTLTADNIDQQIGQLNQQLSWFFNGFSLIIIIIYPIYLISTVFWQTVIQSILLYFVLKINHTAQEYLPTFKIALHIAVTAAILHEVTGYLYPNHGYPIFNLTFWSIMIFMLWSLNYALKTGMLDERE